jgi:hypothetical protein
LLLLLVLYCICIFFAFCFCFYLSVCFVTRSNRTTTCTQAPGAERAGAGAVNMFTGDSSGSVALAAGKWKSKAGGR